MNISLSPSLRSAEHRTYVLVALAAVIWFALYSVLQRSANWLSYTLLALPKGSPVGDALAFFFYDVPKILLLLGGMIFLISLLRTFFSPEQTRGLLGGKREGVGNVLARCSASSPRSARARRCRSSSALSRAAFRSA